MKTYRRQPNVTTHQGMTRDEAVEHLRVWWRHRHGVNSGACRAILKNYIITLREFAGGTR